MKPKQVMTPQKYVDVLVNLRICLTRGREKASQFNRPSDAEAMERCYNEITGVYEGYIKDLVSEAIYEESETKVPAIRPEVS